MMLNFNDGTMKKTILSCEIVFNGNWNYKDKSAPAVLSKPLGYASIGDVKVVFTHVELIQLLELYHEADIFAIEMIENNKVNTGLVDRAETLFLDKLQEWIINKKSSYVQRVKTIYNKNIKELEEKKC